MAPQILPQTIVVDISNHIDAMLIPYAVVGFAHCPIKIGHCAAGAIMQPDPLVDRIGATQTDGVIGKGFV